MKESRAMGIVIYCISLVILGTSCSSTSDNKYLLYKQDVTMKYGHFGLSPEGTVFIVLSNDIFRNEEITSLRKRTGTSERYALLTILKSKSLNSPKIRLNQSIFEELREKGRKYIIKNAPYAKSPLTLNDGHPEIVLLHDELKKLNSRFLGHLVIYGLELKLNDDFDQKVRLAAGLPDRVQILSTMQQDNSCSVLVGVQDTLGLSIVNGNVQKWVDINTLNNLHLSLIP